MRARTISWQASIAALFLLVGLAPAVQAAEVRVIDVAQITWNGASEPSSSMSDVVSAIQNQVSPNWT